MEECEIDSDRPKRGSGEVQVVAISCAKDELDIIEPFVRHTLAHVDRLVILDNGSTDGTRQLLQQLVDDGLPLEVVDDPSLGNYQWRRVTHLMHAYALDKYSADWIVPLDVDEFLTTDDLSAVLRQERERNQVIGLAWQTYVPDVQDDPAEINPVQRIRHRLRNEAHPCIKVIVPSKLARQPGAKLSQGSHFLELEGHPCHTKMQHDGFLAHFPGRSAAQFARKVAVKHLQYLAMSDRLPDWGCHYRAAIELLKKDLASLDAAFQRTILFYNLPEGLSFNPKLIVAPLNYRGGPLKYTPAQPERPFVQSLLECAETIARGHGALSGMHNQLRTNLSELTLELHHREAALEAMHQSWSWRVGRIVTSPVRWLKQGLQQISRNEIPNGGASATEVTEAA